jgi:hypothetical protein
MKILEEFSSGYLMKILDENEYENENWLGKSFWKMVKHVAAVNNR